MEFKFEGEIRMLNAVGVTIRFGKRTLFEDVNIKFNKSCCLLVRLHPKFIGVDLGFVEETNKMLADKVKNASSYPVYLKKVLRQN